MQCHDDASHDVASTCARWSGIHIHVTQCLSSVVKAACQLNRESGNAVVSALVSGAKQPGFGHRSGEIFWVRLCFIN